jgi:hypothetical protein
MPDITEPPATGSEPPIAGPEDPKANQSDSPAPSVQLLCLNVRFGATSFFHFYEKKFRSRYSYKDSRARIREIFG